MIKSLVSKPFAYLVYVAESFLMSSQYGLLVSWELQDSRQVGALTGQKAYTGLFLPAHEAEPAVLRATPTGLSGRDLCHPGYILLVQEQAV